MRIAEINMLHFGSTGKIMLGIADCARHAGHQVWTFSPHVYQVTGNMETPEIKHHMYFGCRQENMLHLALAELTGFHGCFSYFGTKQLLRELDCIQPDVIHLHNLHNWTINLPMLFRYIKKRNIKTIWTLHDCWSFTGQCPHFVEAKCEKWKTGCYDCPQIHHYPKSYVDQTKFMWKKKQKWFNGIENMTLVAPSQWLADLVKQSFLKDYPMSVIHNGIDLQVFHMVQSQFREECRLNEKYIILAVSFGWDHKKGLDVLIELSKRLPESYQLILVGTNEAVDRILPPNIISIHRTNNQHELAKIYTAADVFVNPTREDTFPTVNMEALACGTPVVTFRTGGSPEILDKTCGIVVDCDDVNAMEAAVKQVCETRCFSEEACLKRAKAFDQNDRFAEYVKQYQQEAQK